jgi:hypothetical protein
MNQGLSHDAHQRGRLMLEQHFFYAWNERQHDGKLIGRRIEHDDGDGQGRQVVLVLKVHRDQRVEILCRESEQRAVLDSASA